VSQAYGGYGHPAGSPYPPGILDQSLAPIAYPTATVKVRPTPITFAYSSDQSPFHARLAGLMQQRLTAQGFQVTLKEVQLPQIYAYANDLAHAPDLLLMTNTPDAPHPDTWARILWGSTGGLNFLGYSNKQVDTLLDQGSAATDKKQSDQFYGQAGKLIADDLGILFLADTRDVMVMRKSLGGIEHVPNYPWALRLADLKS
jgi:peptide/nickel transport system substrate-binding protein